jgi:hypothetical protein
VLTQEPETVGGHKQGGNEISSVRHCGFDNYQLIFRNFTNKEQILPDLFLPGVKF